MKIFDGKIEGWTSADSPELFDPEDEFKSIS